MNVLSQTASFSNGSYDYIAAQTQVHFINSAKLLPLVLPVVVVGGKQCSRVQWGWEGGGVRVEGEVWGTLPDATIKRVLNS